MPDEPAITYDAAYTELVTIMNDLQEGETSVDELAAKVKRASELITQCSKMLRATEAEVGEIVKQLGG